MAELIGKPISELPLRSSLDLTALMPVSEAGASYHVTGQTIRFANNKKGIEIESGDDLNDYTTPGSYAVTSGAIAATISNAPYTTGNYRLEVVSSGSSDYETYLKQFLWTSARDTLWTRRMSGGTWSAWTRFVVADEIANIGTAYSDEPSAVSVASAAETQAASLTLPAGTYVIHGGARFASNATGYRRLYIQRGTSSAWIADNQSTPAVSGSYTYVNLVSIVNLTESTEIKLMAYQNSGSALSTSARMYAVRIV